MDAREHCFDGRLQSWPEVFPHVIDAGLVIGSECWLGELQVGNVVDSYYRTASGSIGPQTGTQSKALVLLFMTPESLNRFRNAGTAWWAGADASLALFKVGANGEIGVNVARSPTVALVMTNAGLMAEASLAAVRISRIE